MNKQNTKRILIAGPNAAQPFLDQLGNAAACEQAEIVCLYGLAGPLEYEHWAETDILVAFATPCGARDMDRAPLLTSIVVPSLGFEGIDVAAAAQRGIAVANGHASENFDTVAEAAIMFMLMALYDVRETEGRLRRNVPRSGPPSARMLKGKTIGIIGFGNIAKALVRRLEGWGATILVHSRSPLDVPVQAAECDLATILRKSDILLPLLPLTPETHHMLSRERLLQTKPGVILVNLSRGAIIEEAALADPQVSAHLGPVALDVFEAEPLPMSSPLRSLPNAILTPHEITHTKENLQALFNVAVANIAAAVAGQPMPTAMTQR